MNSGKIVADGWTDGRTGGEIEGSTRGPRGPKKSIGSGIFVADGLPCTGQEGQLSSSTKIGDV